MIIDEIKNIDSSGGELRKFALVMSVPLALIGAFLLWRRSDYCWYLFIASGVFICPGMLVPVVLRPVHKVWMTFAIIMGWLMTRVILSVLFFLILTPTALLLRLLGKDLLNMKFDRDSSESYWLVRDRNESEKADYTKQF